MEDWSWSLRITSYKPATENHPSVEQGVTRAKMQQYSFRWSTRETVVVEDGRYGEQAWNQQSAIGPSTGRTQLKQNDSDERG